MKIATFNVNGIDGRWANLKEWLTAEQPDVVCLQQLEVPRGRFPAALRELGYESIWQDRRPWHGVAILSREGQLIERRRGLPGDPADSGYIEAVVNGVTVACIYAPSPNRNFGPMFEYKIDWLERLKKHAASLVARAHPVVLAGDFSIVPTELDVYDPARWKKDARLHPRSRTAYLDLLKQGWTDTIRSRQPDERIYTFWDAQASHWPGNEGLRVDHLLTNAAAACRVSAVGVDTWARGLPTAGEHAPAWIVLRNSTGRDAVRRPESASKR